MAVIEINTNPSRRDPRWFGLLLTVFLAIVGALVWRRTGSLAAGSAVWAVGGSVSALFALWPASRRRIYVGWMYAVYPTGWTVSHLLLGVVYFVVITPIGLSPCGFCAATRWSDPSTAWRPPTGSVTTRRVALSDICASSDRGRSPPGGMRVGVAQASRPVIARLSAFADGTPRSRQRSRSTRATEGGKPCATNSEKQTRKT